MLSSDIFPKPKVSAAPITSTKPVQSTASSNAPSTSSTPKASDVGPFQSDKPSTPGVDTPTQSTDSKPTSVAPVQEPAKPEPVSTAQETTTSEPETDEKPISPNAGALEVVAWASNKQGKQYYYLKRIEQKDAVCFLTINSVTWDSSLSCIPKPVTNVTSGK